MRRWALRVPLFLLLGAIVNVAVAWGCALAEDSCKRASLYQQSFVDNDGVIHAWHLSHWELMSGEAFESTKEPKEIAQGFVVTNTLPLPEAVAPEWSGLRVPPLNDVVEYDYRIVDCRGWPARSMWYECTFVEGNSGLVAFGGIDLGLDWHEIYNRDWESDLMALERYPRALPLSPIWPGFAINTVFYAVVLWLLFAGPFVLCRWRRLRRGLCPKCAYDLRGRPEGTACPECGAGGLPRVAR